MPTPGSSTSSSPSSLRSAQCKAKAGEQGGEAPLTQHRSLPGLSALSCSPVAGHVVALCVLTALLHVLSGEVRLHWVAKAAGMVWQVRDAETGVDIKRLEAANAALQAELEAARNRPAPLEELERKRADLISDIAKFRKLIECVPQILGSCNTHVGACLAAHRGLLYRLSCAFVYRRCAASCEWHPLWLLPRVTAHLRRPCKPACVSLSAPCSFLFPLCPPLPLSWPIRSRP
jgi:hypothetical protein